MVEPIKAKLVLDVAAGGAGGQDLVGGFANALSSSLQGLDLPVLGDIGAAVGGLVLGLEALFNVAKAGFNRLVDASPRLETSVQLLGKSISLLLRPIGDVLSFFVKPLAIALLRFAIPIYKLWRSFLESPAAEESLAQIDEGVGQVAQGIVTLDFAQVQAGLQNVFEGSIGLLEAFGATFGENISLTDVKDRFFSFLGDAFTYFKDLLVSGLAGIGKLIGIVPDEADIQGFGDLLTTVLTTAWENFLNIFRETVFSPDDFSSLTEAFVVALETASPLFAFLSDIVEKTQVIGEEGTENVSAFGAAINTAKNAILATTSPLLLLKNEVGLFKKTAEENIGTEENKQGIVGSLLETISNFAKSELSANALISRLEAVPRTITTTHYIKTVRI